MPSRLVHAWRAASISPRCASTSGLATHAALTNVLRTSLTSVDDSRDTSAGPAFTPLHHAGGAAAADVARVSEAAAPAVTMNILFIRLSRLICMLIWCGDGDWPIDVQSHASARVDVPAQRVDAAHRC